MQNEQKKPGRTARILNTAFPFKKPAQAAVRPALDGLEIMQGAVDRLKADLRPTPRFAAPETFADAQALWRESAARHCLDAQRIHTIQKSLDYSWMALFLSGTLAFAVGLAGVILIFLGESFTGAGMAGGLLVAAAAGSLLLRTNMRRSQVRGRALVSWPQYLRAAGGILPAIFGDVKLSPAAVDGGK